MPGLWRCLGWMLAVGLSRPSGLGHWHSGQGLGPPLNGPRVCLCARALCPLPTQGTDRDPGSGGLTQGSAVQLEAGHWLPPRLGPPVTCHMRSSVGWTGAWLSAMVPPSPREGFCTQNKGTTHGGQRASPHVLPAGAGLASPVSPEQLKLAGWSPGLRASGMGAAVHSGHRGCLWASLSCLRGAPTADL